MEWLGNLIGAGSGGLLSLFGLGVQHFVDYKQKKMDNAHELAMADKTMAEMTMQIEVNRQLGEQELAIVEEDAAGKSLLSAIESQTAITTNASQWVIDICGMTRPTLTAGLVLGSVGLIAFGSTHPLTPDFLFMATAATLYWFGDRARKK